MHSRLDLEVSGVLLVLLLGLLHCMNAFKLTLQHLSQTRYKLVTFGLPGDLPIISSGNVKLKNHLKWIKMRRAIDEECKKDP